MTKKIVCLGAYGSGKSEYATNLAISFSNCTIIDLDVVNPYFRTRYLGDLFQGHGVNLIAPTASLKYADVPIILPQIAGAIVEKNRSIVLDVGGQVAGSRVIAQFAHLIKSQNFEVRLIVNTHRPDTDTRDKILMLIDNLQISSKLTISHIVANINLMEYTTLELVEKGIKSLVEVAKKRQLILKHYLVERVISKGFPKQILGVKKVEIDRYFRKPWEQS